MTAQENRYRIGLDVVLRRKMPSVKPLQEVTSLGGKRLRTNSGSAFRTEVTRGARVG